MSDRVGIKFKKLQLKPCPFCGGKNLFAEAEKEKFLYGVTIGCLNLNCKNRKLVIRYALSYEKAMDKAEKAWNRLQCE